MIPLLVFLAGGLLAAEPAPDWLDKTILPEEKFIYAVGHSGSQAGEAEAKDAALAAATQEFVKYCGVEVDSFARSVEVYSKEGGKEYDASDLKTQLQVRARAFVSRAIPERWHLRREKKDYLASVLLKVPKEEYDRIVKERNIKLSLDILFYYEGEDKQLKVLTDGSVLKSGDGYAVYLKPSDPCYLYVYQVDALETSLFPNPIFTPPRIPWRRGPTFGFRTRRNFYSWMRRPARSISRSSPPWIRFPTWRARRRPNSPARTSTAWWASRRWASGDLSPSAIPARPCPRAGPRTSWRSGASSRPKAPSPTKPGSGTNRGVSRPASGPSR